MHEDVGVFAQDSVSDAEIAIRFNEKIRKKSKNIGINGMLSITTRYRYSGIYRPRIVSDF
jgi:hypothetical protein